MPDIREQYLDLIEKVILNEVNPENGARIDFLIKLLERREQTTRNVLLEQLVRLHRSNPYYRTALGAMSLPEHWWVMALGFPFSMVGKQRLGNVRYAAETVIEEGIPGAMMETGVWRGGACMMMKAVLKTHNDGRDLYLCDSFQGLPRIHDGPDATLHLDENPLLSVAREDAISHFERLDLLDERVHFIEGWFSETMPSLASRIENLSLLRLDGDYYTSTMDVLASMYDKVSSNGFVIIDDYHCYEQCKLAVDEFLQTRGISPELVEIDGVGVYWRKQET